ncbi:MAG: hypothetical protein NWQ16_11590 [Akkermansiaceae bacterium]|nr:hypothetical protein [Akkermansiaceae bacterium]
MLFHLAVLSGMVVTYDLSKGLAQKLGWLDGGSSSEKVEMDIMAMDEDLSIEIDPELEKLVDVTVDGYLFRKDIPFPPHIKVITSQVTKFKKVRFAGKSQFGEGSMVLSTRSDEVMEYEMAGRVTRFTMKEGTTEKLVSPSEKLAKLQAIAEAKNAGEPPPQDNDKIVNRLVGKAVQFNYDGKAWKLQPSKEFLTMAWGKELEDQVTSQLQANGLLSRSRWFGKERMSPGSETKLSDKSMDLVFDDGEQGKLEMVFKGMEGVHGHPCGVFEVKGSLTYEKTDSEGNILKSEETVEGGKIWCSLLYPAVLRMDLDLVISHETRAKGKLIGQQQGDVSIKLHRQWTPVKPETKKSETPQPKQEAPKESLEKKD